MFSNKVEKCSYIHCVCLSVPALVIVKNSLNVLKLIYAFQDYYRIFNIKNGAYRTVLVYRDT